MARLFRPHIPLSVRVKVISRQLSERGREAIVRTIEKTTETWGDQLHILLLQFAQEISCEVSDLRLDHDPPLGARPQERRGLGKKTYYIPDANDPDHLFYRPHGAQFDGSHDVKTRIRGDHGQYSDIALIKRERRRQRREAKPSPYSKLKRAKQKIKSRNAWPPRGSQKIPKRRK